MGGRHADVKENDAGRKWQYGIVLVVVATILAGVFVLRDKDELAVASCATTHEIRVAAAPEIAEAVKAAAGRVGDDACASYTVEATAPALVAQSLSLGEDPPDLWIPDSSLWVARVKAQLADGAPAPEVATKSLATSPVVLALPKDGAGRPDTWLQAMASSSFVNGDALATTVATAPLLAAQAEAAKGLTSAESVSTALVSVAQRQTTVTAKPTAAAQLADVANRKGSTVVSEQAFVSDAAAAERFVAVVPKTGSMLLDYPLAVTSTKSGASEAAKGLTTALESADGVAALSEAGFRDPSGEPLPDGKGVGQFTPIAIDNPELVEQTLKKWSLIALPAQTLAVIDVSGSMQSAAGDSSRMGLTVQAAITGLSLMPDSWGVGLWAFSNRLSGDQDWKKLSPIRKLGTKVGNANQRDVMKQQINGLPKLVGGGTGLYDTTLAAWRTVQAQYDPKAINSVIMLTDGKNEDSNSLSLSELLATLQRERDPARPVVVIAIGITKDADEAALKKIAKATGGSAYIAREPDEIPKVFVRALEARG